MTPQEAIKNIEIAIAEVEWEYPMQYAIAFEIVIKALEKQIPQKTKNVSDDGVERYICGKCNNLMHRKQYCCDNCGQALGWSNS